MRELEVTLELWEAADSLKKYNAKRALQTCHLRDPFAGGAPLHSFAQLACCSSGDGETLARGVYQVRAAHAG